MVLKLNYFSHNVPLPVFTPNDVVSAASRTLEFADKLSSREFTVSGYRTVKASFSDELLSSIFIFEKIFGGYSLNGFQSKYLMGRPHLSSKALVLPEFYKGEPILTIADEAFVGIQCNGLFLPKYLRKVGVNSFQNALLGNVTFNNTLEIIGEGAFQSASIVALKLPESIQTLGSNCFKNAHINLTSLTIPKKTKLIASNAFEGAGLKQVKFSPHVGQLVVGDYAFANNQLQTVSIPPTILECSGTAFEHNPTSLQLQ